MVAGDMGLVHMEWERMAKAAEDVAKAATRKGVKPCRYSKTGHGSIKSTSIARTQTCRLRYPDKPKTVEALFVRLPILVGSHAQEVIWPVEKFIVEAFSACASVNGHDSRLPQKLFQCPSEMVSSSCKLHSLF